MASGTPKWSLPKSNVHTNGFLAQTQTSHLDSRNVTTSAGRFEDFSPHGQGGPCPYCVTHWCCSNGHIATHLVSIVRIQGRARPIRSVQISPAHRFVPARHDLVNPRCLLYDMPSHCDLVCWRSKCIECDNKIFNLICILNREDHKREKRSSGGKARQLMFPMSSDVMRSVCVNLKNGIRMLRLSMLWVQLLWSWMMYVWFLMWDMILSTFSNNHHLLTVHKKNTDYFPIEWAWQRHICDLKALNPIFQFLRRLPALSVLTVWSV